MNAYSDTPEQRVILKEECMFKPLKVAIVDIDDVLAEFPSVFIDWIGKQTGQQLDFSESQYGLEDAVIKSFTNGQELLDEFYRSHAMMKLPVIPGALDFYRTMKALGFYMVALTGRPGGSFRQTMADTIQWLAVNEFQFDEVCFSRKKGEFVKRYYKAECIIGVEDNARNAKELAHVCDFVYFKNKPKTPQADGHNIFSFWDFKDACDHLTDTMINRHYDATLRQSARS